MALVHSRGGRKVAHGAIQRRVHRVVRVRHSLRANAQHPRTRSGALNVRHKVDVAEVAPVLLLDAAHFVLRPPPGAGALNVVGGEGVERRVFGGGQALGAHARLVGDGQPVDGVCGVQGVTGVPNPPAPRETTERQTGGGV